MYVLRTIIIPASRAAAARELGAALSPAGVGMYLTALSPTGAEPATHYISTGMIEPEFAYLLPLTTIDIDGIATTTPGQPEMLFGAASMVEGLKATLADVKGLLTESDVSEEAPFSALARMGLKLISAE